MNISSLYPAHTIICKVPQSSGEFQTQIQPQRPGRFSNALQRRAPISRCVIIKKADTEYPFEHGEVINYTLGSVSIHPVTTKIQVSFLTRRGRTPLRDFTMRPIATTVTEFNVCERRKLRMDQQHCSYSTILT